MSDPNDFPHHIDHAASHAKAAADQLNHALAMSESHLLPNKHRRLLSTTRNNLTRAHNILNSLIPLAHDAINNHPHLPDFPTAHPTPSQISSEAQSPHNGQPLRSE